MSPVFADLRQLTHSAGCGAAVTALMNNVTNCDPFGRQFNYTPLSLGALRALHVRAARTEMLGVALGISSLLVVSALYSKATESKNLRLAAAAVAILGFPFQLALEWGNSDLVAFALCVALCALSLWERKTARWAAAVCAFLASALKLFPAVGILLWCSTSRRRERSLIEWFGPAALGVLTQARYLPQILNNTPKPDGKAISFGLLAAYQERVGFPASALLVSFKVLLGVAAFSLAGRQLGRLSTQLRSRLFARDTLDSSTFALFASISAAVYVVGRSFDYRLIFLLGMVPLLLNWLLRCETGQHKAFPLLMTSLITAISLEQYATNTVGKLVHVGTDVLLQPVFFGATVALLAAPVLLRVRAVSYVSNRA